MSTLLSKILADERLAKAGPKPAEIRETSDRLRSLRVEAHRAFDVLWQRKPDGSRGRMCRNAAYEWLAVELGLTRALIPKHRMKKDSQAFKAKDRKPVILRELCHFAKFDAETCERAIVICKRALRRGGP